MGNNGYFARVMAINTIISNGKCRGGDAGGDVAVPAVVLCACLA